MSLQLSYLRSTQIVATTIPRALYLSSNTSNSISISANSYAAIASSLFTSAGAVYTNITLSNGTNPESGIANTVSIPITVSGNYTISFTVNFNGNGGTNTNTSSGAQIWFFSTALGVRLAFNAQFAIPGQLTTTYAGPLVANDIIYPTIYSYSAGTLSFGKNNTQISVACSNQFA